MKTVCLFGNGTSIPYNSGLSVQELTQQLCDQFEKSGNDYLVDLASHSKANSLCFESLLGPLDTIASKLLNLPEKASLPGKLGKKLEESAREFDGIYRQGVGITLDLIAELSHSTDGGGKFDSVTRKLTDALFDLHDSSGTKRLTIGTLNYDCQLLAGLLKKDDSQVCDLAWGLQAEYASIYGHTLERFWMRTDRHSFATLSNRIKFLQLHGSLGWLRGFSATGKELGVFKYEVDALRKDGKSESFWKRYKDDPAPLFKPCVVLTNEKSDLIDSWPFKLAYDLFLKGLKTADRVLIAGYGFGDRPLNKKLSEALEDTDNPKRILIVERAGADKKQAQQKVFNGIGLAPADYSLSLDGVPGAVDTDLWKDWAAD